MLLRLDASCPDLSKNVKSTRLLGFTRDVPFSPLKEKVTTRVADAQADNVEVDLLAWSLPQETAEEAKARVILCNFAVRWWAHNLKRETMRWWNQNVRELKDLAAIQDILFQACCFSYWQWHQGSRLFFWRFLPKFREQMRDGMPFHHIAPCPVRRAHNMPSPSSKAKIECCKKVF
jgi:hypothetical protein